MSIEENKTPESVDNNNETPDSKSGLLGNIDLESILGESAYTFYTNHKQKVNIVGIITLVAVVGVLGYFVVWKNMFVLPNETKSYEEQWRAESEAYDKNNWSNAINGDSLGDYKGLSFISKEYAGYSGGNIALYNLGISYLNNGENKNAIETFKKVSFEDELLGTISIGAIGDAHMQDGSVSDAYTFYTKAYSRKDNELTSPIYMMKAAFCLEIEGKFKEAIDLYEKVRLKYPASELSFKAEKYMESLKLGNPIYTPSKGISE